jgi:Sulfotransferase family
MIRAKHTPENELSENVRPLFVVGCPRSGTTAFADYLNQHPEILVCRERYSKTPWASVSRDLFAFERILDFGPEATHTPSFTSWANYHTELLAKKDPTKLKWIGDKAPNRVRQMDLLEKNNPGARFIVLYRPIEEVAESTDDRSKDPNDSWFFGKDGFEMALEAWNASMRKMRDFIEGNPIPRVLIVDYHDFFDRNEIVAPLLSRFLGLEFDEAVTKTWRKASLEFESGRRYKKPLSKEQYAFIQEHADRAAEAWVLDRIEKQPREPGLYVEETRGAALASLNEAEAKAWRLQQRVNTLEDDLAHKHQETRRLKKRTRQLKVQNRRLKKRTRQLKVQKQNPQSLKTLGLLNKLRYIRTRVSRKLRRKS